MRHTDRSKMLLVCNYPSSLTNSGMIYGYCKYLMAFSERVLFNAHLLYEEHGQVRQTCMYMYHIAG